MALATPSSLLASTHSADALRDPTLSALRARASSDPRAAIKEVAKQFEALFMHELMKSMRQATLSSGMLENSGTQLGSEMLDTHYATQMTGLRGGLSEAIARQLERQMDATPTPVKPVVPAGVSESATEGEHVSGHAHQIEFVQLHQGAARAVQERTGIPAAYMLGQAAHESGWGRREIRNVDGSNSHNVFGIKAGSNWDGPVAEITTTEFIDGKPRKLTQRFRAYASYEESFQDYARLMKGSSRYADVLASTGSAEQFAQGLQRAGYATDPNYADKLSRVINTTLRLQRMGT